MARSHGRIMAAIWSDGDFIAMRGSAQRMFMFLLSQSDLNHAGLIPMRVRRWAKKADDLTADAIDAELDYLATRGFLVTDDDTEEVLIRTFVRNDGVYKQPRVMDRLREDAKQIESPALRAAFRVELDRLPLHELSAEPGGPNADKPSTREQVERVVAALREDFGNPPEGVSETLPDTPRVRAGALHQPPTTIHQPPATDHPDKPLADESAEPDRFDEFWDTYDYKLKRVDAAKAWTRAIRKEDPGRIIAAAGAYVAHVRADKANRGERAPDQAHAASWLNGERWNDERKDLPIPMTRVQQGLALVQQLAAEEANQPRQIGHQR